MISERSYEWASEQEPDMDNWQSRVEPFGACEQCGVPAVDLRYPWDNTAKAFGEIALCQSCADDYDANQEPGDSFYEGRF